METKYKVIVTPQTANQILECARYIKNVLCAPIAAEEFLNMTEAKIASLEQFPNRVALTAEEPWRSCGVHKMVADCYLICFWVNEEKQRVYVIAFTRGSRNQRQVLEKINFI